MNTKQIKVSDRPNAAILKIIKEVQAAVLEGYYFPEEIDANRQPHIAFNPGYITLQIEMKKDDVDVTDVVQTIQQATDKLNTSIIDAPTITFNKEEAIKEIEATQKHADLKEVAKKYNLVHKKHLKNPNALRKDLITQMEDM